MHRHFILLAFAILFELIKIASSRRRWQSNGKCAGLIFNTGNVNCGGHKARTCSQCPCNGVGGYYWTFCSGDCQWSGGVCHMRQISVKCAGFIYNTGNVSCGGHKAKKCSQCLCNKQGIHMGSALEWGRRYCNRDCQWSGDHRSGVCHMRQKINKGEWPSRDTTTQGCCGGHVLDSVDLHMGG